MNLRWLLLPRYGLLILIPAAFSIALFIWVQQDPSTRDPSFLLNLSAGAFTALLAAGVAMWIYRYLTFESQDRRFRHDLEVRHFEHIYGPLYEEAGNVVEGLREYQAPMAQFWEKMKRGRFGPFVEPAIAHELDVLRNELDNLGRLAGESNLLTRGLVTQAIGGYPITKKLSPDDSRRLMMTLHQDSRLLFHPKLSLPREDVIRSVQELLEEAASPIPEEEIPEFFLHVKRVVMTNPVLEERETLTEKILPHAEDVQEMILRRMRNPFRPGKHVPSGAPRVKKD